MARDSPVADVIWEFGVWVQGGEGASFPFRFCFTVIQLFNSRMKGQVSPVLRARKPGGPGSHVCLCPLLGCKLRTGAGTCVFPVAPAIASFLEGVSSTNAPKWPGSGKVAAGLHP